MNDEELFNLTTASMDKLVLAARPWARLGAKTVDSTGLNDEDKAILARLRATAVDDLIAEHLDRRQQVESNRSDAEVFSGGSKTAHRIQVSNKLGRRLVEAVRNFRPLSVLPVPQIAYAGVQLRSQAPVSLDAKQLSLNEWFSPKELRGSLCWLASVRIQRAGTKESPSFAAFGELSGLRSKGKEARLKILLRSSAGAMMEVRLSRRNPTQIFGQHALPFDWSELSYSIFIG